MSILEGHFDKFTWPLPPRATLTKKLSGESLPACLCLRDLAQVILIDKKIMLPASAKKAVPKLLKNTWLTVLSHLLVEGTNAHLSNQWIIPQAKIGGPSSRASRESFCFS